MFVRKKRNKSGSVSIHVVDKKNGYKVVAALGTSRDPDEIQRLLHKGHSLVREYTLDPAQGRLMPVHTPAEHTIDQFVDTLSNSNIRTIGPELIFGTLFDRIGFDQINDKLFHHLVISRLAYPYAIYKELELKKKGVEMSAKRAGELTQNMYAMEYLLPDSQIQKSKVFQLDGEQQLLFNAVHK